MIIKEESFLALYKGLLPSLLREGTYSTLRLGLYEPYRDFLSEKVGLNKHSIITKFLAGLMSGSTGALVSTPFDL